jgi:DnaK suppressor protein
MLGLQARSRIRIERLGTIEGVEMDKTSMNGAEQQLRTIAEVVRQVRDQDRVGILVERSAETCEQETLAGQRELAFLSLTRNCLLLREVRAALDRICDGEYGHCLECAVAISEARLRAVPYARHCLSCQERIDLQSDRASPRFAA